VSFRTLPNGALDAKRSNWPYALWNFGEEHFELTRRVHYPPVLPHLTDERVTVTEERIILTGFCTSLNGMFEVTNLV
jgi:hypothetical protein